MTSYFIEKGWLIKRKGEIYMEHKERFEDIVNPLLDKFIPITISDEKMEKIEDFIIKVIEEKKKEKLHQVNGNNEEKRWRTGLTGEAAIEEHLGIEIIDWTIGESKKYSRPDVKKLGVGIKNSQWGNFPLISKVNTYPQVICIQTGYNEVLICGVASADVLNTYQDDDLVLDWRAKYYAHKTGFYGFEYLEPIETLKI
jgi:hypothetical protein